MRLISDTEGKKVTNAPSRPLAVLFDRDGTLVHDVPYNGDVSLVEPVPDAKATLARLRREGIPTAVVTNQSGVGRGLLIRDQVDAVNARMAELLGPLGPVFVCEHAPDDGCPCRKPAPGLILQAAAALGVPASACALVGDRGSDIGAALAAGARPILVPSPATTDQDLAAAPEIKPSLAAALELLLDQ